MNINRVLTIMVALALFMVVSSTVANLIPWYRQAEPMIVIKINEPFKPGDPMPIKIERNALIGFEGRVTRELVKIHADGSEEEVYKLDKLISINRGKKNIVVYYRVPTLPECPQISGNTYVWRGSLVYKPFGFLEKTYFFRTEKFQLTLDKKT